MPFLTDPGTGLPEPAGAARLHRRSARTGFDFFDFGEIFLDRALGRIYFYFPQLEKSAAAPGRFRASGSRRAVRPDALSFLV
jgi:hypothetical protein